jgi:hypothetical protein
VLILKIRGFQEVRLMRPSVRSILFCVFLFGYSTMFSSLQAQSNSGSVRGSVTDPSGAAVPGATVTIQNPVSGYSRTTTNDAAGQFRFTNLPLNPYHVSASASGFSSVAGDANVASNVPV